MDILFIILIFGSICAVFDAVVNILILFKVKMHFNCNIYAAQYIMAVAVLLDISESMLTNAQILLLFIAAILLFVVITATFYNKGFVFVRIFGLEYKMHNVLKDKLSRIANKNNLNRTNIYIYGGDSKTPCNTLVFRQTSKPVIKSVSKELNKFLKTYTSPNILSHTFAIVLDIAVVYILYFVF